MSVNILTKEERDKVISYHSYDKINIHQYEHRQGIHRDRIDYNISIVPRDEKTQWFFNKIHNFLLPMYPKSKVNEMDIFYNFEYHKGMKFTRHIDKRRDCSWHLVVGGTLNSNFKGGRLLTYNPDLELASSPGELYHMPAEQEHEVTEITEGVRYSFVFFISKYWLGIPKTIL